MKVGRNDPCICGSGRKYKKCCYNWRENWTNGIEKHECEKQIKQIVRGAYDFIIEHDYQGGCHLISAILYILLTEKGYKPILKLGEVRVNDIIFDHSWIELDNKVIDVAIMNTLQDDVKLPPVLLGKSVATGCSVNYQYGVSENIDATAQLVIKQSIGQYIMAGSSHGSFKIMELIAGKAGVTIDNVEDVISKYYDSYRVKAVAE